jgi:hypothetical protein
MHAPNMHKPGMCQHLLTVPSPVADINGKFALEQSMKAKTGGAEVQLYSTENIKNPHVRLYPELFKSSSFPNHFHKQSRFTSSSHFLLGHDNGILPTSLNNITTNNNFQRPY